MVSFPRKTRRGTERRGCAVRKLEGHGSAFVHHTSGQQCRTIPTRCQDCPHLPQVAERDFAEFSTPPDPRMRCASFGSHRGDDHRQCRTGLVHDSASTERGTQVTGEFEIASGESSAAVMVRHFGVASLPAGTIGRRPATSWVACSARPRALVGAYGGRESSHRSGVTGCQGQLCRLGTRPLWVE